MLHTHVDVPSVKSWPLTCVTSYYMTVLVCIYSALLWSLHVHVEPVYLVYIENKLFLLFRLSLTSSWGHVCVPIIQSTLLIDC